jgi:hypothetical protein
MLFRRDVIRDTQMRISIRIQTDKTRDKFCKHWHASLQHLFKHIRGPAAVLVLLLTHVSCLEPYVMVQLTSSVFMEAG